MMFRTLRKTRHSLAALAIVVLLPPGQPALADAAANDPVVADVVRMLDAGLESRLIVGWLESGNKRPGPLSANDMIALAAAEAPAALIEELLARSTRPTEVEDAPPSGPHAPEAQQHDAPEQTVGSVSAANCCLVNFSVEYRAPEQDGSEPADAPRGELYLYIDGDFLRRVAPRSEIAGRGPQLFKHRIAPGRHTIRLTRELHLASKNKQAGDARDHVTTVSPSSINFELQPGAQWDIAQWDMDIRWTQGVFSRSRPLRWRWSKNGEQVAGEKGVGAVQDDWPFLCDDIDISRDSGAISEWRATDRSRDCVTWASLWPLESETSRVRILSEFESAGFRPGIDALD